MRTPTKSQQSGFTLLELVVVVAVLGLITNLATEFVAQNSNQERFEATKARQAIIREAILGNPSATQNGEVQISGFIADMGRAPNNLRELLTNKGYCGHKDHLEITERPEDPAWNPETECNSAAGAADTWVSDLGDEWQGPYIQGFELESITYKSTSLQVRTFRDSWGNSGESWKVHGQEPNELIYADFLNFGWNYYVGANPTEGTGVDLGQNENLNDIFVISAGLNGAKDPGSDATEDRTAATAQFTSYSSQNRYEQDYPKTEYSATGASNPDPEYDLKHTAAIQDNEYMATANVSINNTGTGSVNVCVVIWNTDASREYASATYAAPVGQTMQQLEVPHGQYFIDVVLDPGSCDLASIDTPTTSSQCSDGSAPVILSTKTSLALNCQM